MSQAIVDRLGGVEVSRPDGMTLNLATCWEQRPVVLVLLRHFGCLFCKEQATHLESVRPQIEAMGADLLFVGSGTPEHARWFIEDFGIQAAVYSDEAREAYRALGARSGLATSLHPRTLWRGMRAFLRGHRQSRTMGDANQQGGVCIVTPAGAMPYRYVSAYAGDHPDPAEVLNALEGIGVHPQPREVAA